MGVQDQVRERLLEPAKRELGQAVVQALVDGRDGRCREAVAAQLLGDGFDFAGGDTLDVYLGQGVSTQRASRSCGTRSSSLPTRVTRMRL